MLQVNDRVDLESTQPSSHRSDSVPGASEIDELLPTSVRFFSPRPCLYLSICYPIGLVAFTACTCGRRASSCAPRRRPETRMGPRGRREKAHDQLPQARARDGTQGMSGRDAASVVIYARQVPVRARYVPKGGRVSPRDGRFGLCGSPHVGGENGRGGVCDCPRRETHDAVRTVFPFVPHFVSIRSPHRHCDRSSSIIPGVRARRPPQLHNALLMVLLSRSAA